MTLRPSVVAAIIVHNGRVLLVRRRVSEATLSWHFPAGESEPGEEHFATAAREVAEEVGLTVTPTVLIGERDHPGTGRRVIYVGCTAEVDAATLVDDEELAELAWCDWTGLHARIPHGLFEPVAIHLQHELTAQPLRQALDGRDATLVCRWRRDARSSRLARCWD